MEKDYCRRRVVMSFMVMIFTVFLLVGVSGTDAFANNIQSKGTLKVGNNPFTIDSGDTYFDFTPSETAAYTFADTTGRVYCNIVSVSSDFSGDSAILLKGKKYYIMVNNAETDPANIDILVEKNSVSKKIADYEVVEQAVNHKGGNVEITDIIVDFHDKDGAYRFFNDDFSDIVDVYYTDDNTENIYVDDTDKLSKLTWKKGIPKRYSNIIMLKGKGDFSGEIYFNSCICDIYNISDSILDYISETDYTGKEYDINKNVKLSYTDDISGKEVYLKYGKDFKCAGFVRENLYHEDGTTKWTAGVPKEAGRYYIKLEGIAPYNGICEINIAINDKNDIRSYSFLAWSIYNGKELGANIIEADTEFVDSKGNTIKNKISLNKDFKITGYCDQKTYEKNTGKEDSISWIKGLPTNKGSYCLKIEGVGSYRGVVYIEYDINDDSWGSLDLKKSKITKLDKSSVSFKTLKTGYLFYEIRPSVDGEYSIYTRGKEIVAGNTKYNADIDTVGVLYDSKGVPICINDDANIKDKDGAGGYNFLIKQTLEVGRTYYLGIRGVTDEHNEKLLTEEEGLLYIEGPNKKYTYYTGPEKKETTTEKKEATTENNADQKKPLAKGKTFKAGGFKYKVTVSNSKKKKYEVRLVKNTKKNAKKIVVKASVKYKGFTYKVTSIGAKAFKNNKKLTKVTIGKNVKSIGKNAFSGCKKLGQVIIKTTKLKTVGTKAFKTAKQGAKFKCPKKKKKAYSKLLKKSGLPKKAKITK